MKTVGEMWAELEKEGCVVCRGLGFYVPHIIRDKNGDLIASIATRDLAIRCAYATLHPERAEAEALHRAVDELDRQATPQPEPAPVDAPDPDADLALRLLSLVRDGYWITPMGDGRYDWSLSENEQHICPDLESAIAAAETHRREQQQPKPVWYCLVPGRGEPRVPHNSESDAATEAARLAKIERRPVQVLGVVQVVRPDQT